MAKGKAKGKTASKKKKSALQLTRRGIALWMGVAVVVSAWTFVLGIMVGRETAPVKFEIKRLEKKLAALRATDLKKELKRFKIDFTASDEKSDFGFYEALKSEKNEIKLPPIPVVKKKTPPPAPKKDTAAKKQVKKEPEKPAKVVAVKKRTEYSTKKLTVQVASLRDVNDAGRLIITLKKLGYPAYMKPAKIPGKGTWYRVRIGSFKTKTEASRTLARLKKAQYKGIIIKY